jgi:tRNA threonylcarbamoyl adenosine modification protein (Sua5/YciO/YrdC/YwlC family)
VGLSADAADRLRTGGLAVLPTDTVYGIACAAGLPDACAELYALKERPAGQPTAIMAGSVAGLLGLLPELSARTAELCRAVLPGQVTLVVENPGGRFPHLCGDAPDRIGVRVPLLELEVAALADAAGGLLITSANLRGRPAPGRLADVPRELTDRAAVVVDGGELPGAASSVIDVTGEQPVVLRDGPGVDRVLESALRLRR